MFEMTTDRVIDLALNLAGYLVAGALMLVVYNWFTNRQPAKAKVAKPTKVAPESQPQAQPTAPRPKPADTAGVLMFGQNARSGKPGHSRRSAVIKQAREMLREGSTPADIKSSLPITEAELAFLSLENK